MKSGKLILVLVFNVLILPAILVLNGCESPAESEERSWKLVWQDEFNGAAGSLPDTLTWNFDVGTGWGNAQLEYDTKRPENVSLNGEGFLEITARKEPYLGSNYTSGRITTKNNVEFTYGKIEARMKLPWGQGMWPAFWLLGADVDTKGWPACGEIDIMENRGQMPARVHGTVHGPGYSGSAGKSKQFDLVNDRFDTGFHTFAVEWSEREIKFLVNGILYHTVKPEDLPGEWVFNKNFFIILNLAVGGNYVGPVGTNTVFPQSLVVDYVRVYREEK
ncbi:MAG: glycoside hydrolase family 16 protein [Ignavibacteriaceae bacterium]|nr:glycoside hydrolase family 16 protein [Ignavibacteriaceae bacterium]